MENLNALKEPPEGLPPVVFDVWETHLPQRLGVSLDDLRELRVGCLREGVHWKKIKRRVTYCAQGVQALTEALEASEPPESAAASPGDVAEDSGPVRAAVTTVTLVVFRGAQKNAHIIEAHLPDTNPADPQQRLRVRVKHSEHFVRGMQIPAIEIGPGFYELGRPCPRWRGKW